MTEKAQQQAFFVQDPFTEEVKGPLSVSELKQWFAKGGVEGWSVSKSPNGPWTLASQVKGLTPPKPPEIVNPIPVAPPQTQTVQAVPVATPSPVAIGSSRPLREKASAAYDLAKQYFPKSLIGRVLVSIAGIWLGFLILLGIPFGIGILWSETFGSGARAREARAEAEAQRIRTWNTFEEVGGKAYKDETIREAEYERAKKQLGR